MDTIHFPIGPLPFRILTSRLRPGGKEKLASISKPFEFPPNCWIFSVTDGPAAMWTVLQGRACILRPQIVEHGVRDCGRGIFGLTETIAGIKYQESLLSDTFCTCTRVDRDDLFDLLGGENEACSELLRAISRNYLESVRRAAA